MSQRKRGITLPQLSILSGPDSYEPETKNGARAGAGRREDVVMNSIAQRSFSAKQNTFGIGEPDHVTDLATLLAAKSVSVQQEAETKVGYRHVGRVQMSLPEWDAVAPNPRQRDTVLHAKKAKHLRTYDPIHRFVSMALLPQGDKIKIDGHTRSYLWAEKEVDGPETVFVDVYACDSQDVAEELYSKFDSQSAVETGADKIAGAARRQKLEFTSGMLRSGRYGSAIKRLYVYTTKAWGNNWGNHDFVYAAVAFYAAELKLLDKVNPTPGAFPSGIVMAALATFKRRGPEALPFWIAYAEERGIKDGVHRDGVQALLDAVAKSKAKASGKSGDGGQALQLGLLGKGILACEAYRSGQMYKVGKSTGIRDKHNDTLTQYLRYSAGA